MKYKILLIVILLVGLVLRLYRFDNPIGDWHAFRQADTSAVSKVFVQNGINPLYPAYFDISNIQSGLDNPNGYRMVEFPVYNILQAGGYNVFGFITLEQWGRIITIFSSLLAVLFIFLIVRKYTDQVTGLFSAFFYAVLPFSIFYGRVILPDPTTAMAILGGIYFFDNAISGKNVRYSMLLVSIIFTSLAFLLKPFALFFTLPMLYIAWNVYGIGFLKKWFLWAFLVFSVTPLVLWRIWITQFPEGIPASTWLFNEGNIRFTGAQFYWIFGDRIGKLILGYIGYTFLLLGFLKRSSEKHMGFFLSFAVCSFLYIMVIARGNVQHDYYQILILPTICIFLGRGVSYILSLSSSIKNSFYNTVATFSLVAFTVLGMLFLSWYHVRDFFNVNNESLIVAGKIAQEKLPKDARVIAANNGDTSFLYYVGRKGWPAYQKSPEELSQMGAQYIVIPNPTEEDKNGLGSQYSHFYESPEVLILELLK